MIKVKKTFNPFTQDFQKIIDKDTIAEKEHTHLISDVQGLSTILNALNNGQSINLVGGYLAQ